MSNRLPMEVDQETINPSKESIAAEIEEIDKEIAELSEKIRVLRARRNSIVPISCLQPEIIISIFLSLQSLCLVDPREYYDWIMVSRVSRLWRSLVLDTSSLWGGIVSVEADQRHFADLSLKRSGCSHLDIVFHHHGVHPPSFELCQRILTDNSSRIRSLNVRVFDNSGLYRVDEASDCLAQHLPVLKALELFGFGQAGIDYTDSHRFLVAPNLRSLRLTHAQIKLPWTGYSEITHLDITDANRGVHFTVSSLLRILIHTKKLTTLKVQWAHPSIDSERIDGPIYLPYLSHLSLNAGMDELISILTNIRIPSHISVHIQQNIYLETSQAQAGHLLSALSGCFVGGPRVVRKFEYSAHYAGIDLKFWDVDPTLASSSTALPTIAIRVILQPCTEWIANFLFSDWISLARLQATRLITVNPEPLEPSECPMVTAGEDPSTAWTFMRSQAIPEPRSDSYLIAHYHLAILPALSFSPLSELLLTESFAPEALDYMADHPESFPSLEKLTIHEEMFRLYTLVRLCDAVENRSNAGFPSLRNLLICSDGEEDADMMGIVLERLRGLVSEVILDIVEPNEIPRFFYT
ncbi:hypothetical protein BDN72DRAFT_837695 [Pluteus cervinus]|uniref:Uncharacterized protein n=1 Tax=Pluteus cervinus TaxID=181527 RepID=A0ACD3B0J1_9AGAR|nr:hypothetical protein BDN72DRAFT_837695 [Pluteus cervinus]